MPTNPRTRPTGHVLFAPDGGLPGIPGGGPSGIPGDDGLSGISGSKPSSRPNLEKPADLGGSQPTPPPLAGPGPVFQQPNPAPVAQGGVYELSGWWRRVGASFVDGIIVGIIAVPLTLLIVGVFGFTSSDSITKDSQTASDFAVGSIVAGFGIGILVLVLYAPIMMAKTNGATLGKKATGIRVVRADGQRMTFWYAAYREILIKSILVGVVGSITFYIGYLLDYLWPLWDSEHRALHDMVVKTRVVRG